MLDAKLEAVLSKLVSEWQKKQAESVEMQILLKGALQAVEVIKEEMQKPDVESESK